MLRYPKTDPCPTCHVVAGDPCVHYGTTEARDEPHRERMPEWWNTDWSAGYEAALAALSELAREFETFPDTARYVARPEVAKRIRAALADTTGALAKVKADTLREAAEDVAKGAPVGNETYTGRQVSGYLTARADRIEAEAAGR